VPFTGQVAEEIGDLLFAHLVRVTFVKHDKAPNPIHIRLFGPDAVMLHPRCQRTRSSSFGFAGVDRSLKIDDAVAEGVIERRFYQGRAPKAIPN